MCHWFLLLFICVHLKTVLQSETTAKRMTVQHSLLLGYAFLVLVAAVGGGGGVFWLVHLLAVFNFSVQSNRCQNFVSLIC